MMTRVFYSSLSPGCVKPDMGCIIEGAPLAIGGTGGVTDDTSGGDMPIPGTPGGRGGRGMGGTAGKPVIGPILGIPTKKAKSTDKSQLSRIIVIPEGDFLHIHLHRSNLISG